MWSLEYVQVPIERKLKRHAEVKSQENPDTASDKEDEVSPPVGGGETSKKMELFKQMQSISSHDDNGKPIFYLCCLCHFS